MARERSMAEIRDKYIVLHRKLIELAESIFDEHLRKITVDLIKDPRITFANVTAKISFYESPAAPQKHHSYPGGLLEHTYSVALTASALSDVYSRVYGVSVDKDLVISCALLHDIFKYYQYEKDPITGGYRIRTDWFLSHEFSVIAELAKRNAPERLLRCISEVHGTTPFSTIEGLIVHEADASDASYVSILQTIVWNACRDVETDTGIPAIKVFHKALSKKPLVELIKTYYEGGRENLIKTLKLLIQ